MSNQLQGGSWATVLVAGDWQAALVGDWQCEALLLVGLPSFDAAWICEKHPFSLTNLMQSHWNKKCFRMWSCRRGINLQPFRQSMMDLIFYGSPNQSGGQYSTMTFSLVVGFVFPRWGFRQWSQNFWRERWTCSNSLATWQRWHFDRTTKSSSNRTSSKPPMM